MKNTFLAYFSYKLKVCSQNPNSSRCKPGAGNYFCPRVTVYFFRCLAGQIAVKKANIKLKVMSLRAGCSPRAGSGPLLNCKPNDTYVTRFNIISSFFLNLKLKCFGLPNLFQKFVNFSILWDCRAEEEI